METTRAKVKGYLQGKLSIFCMFVWIKEKDDAELPDLGMGLSNP